MENIDLLDECLDLLYILEDHFEYDKTDFGKIIGLLINKIQAREELTNEEIMDRILKLKMTKGVDVRDEIIRLQQIIDERISNN